MVLSVLENILPCALQNLGGDLHLGFDIDQRPQSKFLYNEDEYAAIGSLQFHN
ncbi:Uncharacterised protein [Chlamydia trachomatis]|nr:Uncharacterised protein [Chlamydia trachomatis]